MIFNVQMTGGVNTKDATATANDILSGKTAYVGKEKVVGSMANNGNVDTAIVNGVLQDGYTSGGQIENLVAENIKKGVSIGGLVGTLPCLTTGKKIASIYVCDSYQGRADLQIYDCMGHVLFDGVTDTRYSDLNIPFVGDNLIISAGLGLYTTLGNDLRLICSGSHMKFVKAINNNVNVLVTK